MIRKIYNYPTPPIRDIKRKETQPRNNWTLMETSLAESQSALNPPMVYSTDRSKAVVPVLVLLFGAL